MDGGMSPLLKGGLTSWAKHNVNYGATKQDHLELSVTAFFYLG